MIALKCLGLVAALILLVYARRYPLTKLYYCLSRYIRQIQPWEVAAWPLAVAVSAGVSYGLWWYISGIDKTDWSSGLTTMCYGLSPLIGVHSLVLLGNIIVRRHDKQIRTKMTP